MKAPANFDTITRKKQKLIHSTYRIKEDVIRAVEKEATKRGVPTGSLVNKILENYVTSEMYFEQTWFYTGQQGFSQKGF